VLAGTPVAPGMHAAPSPVPAAFTVGVLAGQLADPSVTPEVYAAVRGALDTLAAAGWQIREVSAPWTADAAEWEEVLTAIVAREAHEVHRSRDASRYAAGTRALLEFGATVTAERYDDALGAQLRLTAAVDASLAGVDVLAGPTVGFTAPEQDPPFGVGEGGVIEDNAEGRFTGPYNLTGHPAISLPAPARGLPAGLQLAGRRGGDADLLLAAAAAAQLLLGSPAGTSH